MAHRHYLPKMQIYDERTNFCFIGSNMSGDHVGGGKMKDNSMEEASNRSKNDSFLLCGKRYEPPVIIVSQRQISLDNTDDYISKGP